MILPYPLLNAVITKIDFGNIMSMVKNLTNTQVLGLTIPDDPNSSSGMTDLAESEIQLFRCVC